MSLVSPSTTTSSSASRSWPDLLLRWIRERPLEVILMALLLGGLLYFYGFYRVFNMGAWSTMKWASRAWNSENDLEYGWAIMPVALGIAWYHRQQLLDAPKSNSWVGLF